MASRTSESVVRTVVASCVTSSRRTVSDALVAPNSFLALVKIACTASEALLAIARWDTSMPTNRWWTVSMASPKSRIALDVSVLNRVMRGPKHPGLQL